MARSSPPGRREAGGRDPDRRGVLGTLFRYELRMLLRDKRTIFFSVVLPLILLPAFLFIMRFSEERAEARREARTYEYALVGSRADLARSLFAEARTLPGADTAGGLEETEPADPDSALAAGEVDVLVVALSPEEARARGDSTQARGDSARARSDAVRATDDTVRTRNDTAAVPVLVLRFRRDNERSEDAVDRVRDALERVRERRRDRVYQEAGLVVDPSAVAAVEREAAASAERESGALLALWLTPVLIMLMLSGGSVVAADTISGEKERGTLETLLTTSARRRDIVWAKQALIIATGIAITVINVANLALYLGLGLFDLPERFVISVAPTSLVLLLLLFLPLTVLISGVLLMLSGYAKSYKEYQLYFFPVMIVFLVPSAAAVLPGMELASAVAFVPMANVSVAVREVLMGEYDWPFLAVTIGVTAGAALLVARLTERALSTEKLITAAEMDEADLRGGPALFPRRVLRWFGILWVALFLTSNMFAGELGIRGQVSFNLLVLFLGASILMLRRYRLDPTRALALRLPRPAVWPAVLLGAPSAFIVGVGVGQLGQLVLPIPDRLIEAFGQFMVPTEIPLWQVVLFLAVLPGIVEELTFRGLLLHGLRRRLRPVALVLVTGAIFGFFHVQLFRLIPTAYLGAVLATVTLLTGSIYPAMLWHALNNAVALVPAYLGWWPDDFVVPAWGYVAAALGLAVAFGILWANRTVYPGLRTGDGLRSGTGAGSQGRPGTTARS